MHNPNHSLEMDKAPSNELENRSHRADLYVPSGIPDRHEEYVSCKKQAGCAQYVSDYPQCVHRAPFKADLACVFDAVAFEKVFTC